MTSNSDQTEYLKDRRREHLRYPNEIGVPDAEWGEKELVSLVPECLIDLGDAVENLPATREATNKSNNNKQGAIAKFRRYCERTGGISQVVQWRAKTS